MKLFIFLYPPHNFKVAENVVNGNFIIDVELTRSLEVATPEGTPLIPATFLVSVSNGTAIEDEDFVRPLKDSRPTTRHRFPTDSKFHTVYLNPDY